MNYQDQIQSFLAERFLFDGSAAIEPTQSLLRAGILDSTGVMEVVFFMEEKFGIRVRDEEMVADNFDTIAGMVRFVESKAIAGKAA
jgi:acyl carrier protein